MSGSSECVAVLFVIRINWVRLDHWCHELRKINYIHILRCATFESLSVCLIQFALHCLDAHTSRRQPFKSECVYSFNFICNMRHNPMLLLHAKPKTKATGNCFLDPRKYNEFVQYWLFRHIWYKAIKRWSIEKYTDKLDDRDEAEHVDTVMYICRRPSSTTSGFSINMAFYLGIIINSDAMTSGECVCVFVCLLNVPSNRW